jgi:hypothetical protein
MLNKLDMAAHLHHPEWNDTRMTGCLLNPEYGATASDRQTRHKKKITA